MFIHYFILANEERTMSPLAPYSTMWPLLTMCFSKWPTFHSEKNRGPINGVTFCAVGTALLRCHICLFLSCCWTLSYKRDIYHHFHLEKPWWIRSNPETGPADSLSRKEVGRKSADRYMRFQPPPPHQLYVILLRLHMVWGLGGITVHKTVNS